MSLLVLGDLHGVRDWYAWTAERIPRYDLVALPGDLTDMSGNDWPRQKDFVRDWIADAARFGTPLAWCSGNHDTSRWSFDYPSALPPGGCWTDRLRHPSVVGDLETKCFQTRKGAPFIVTSLPDGIHQTDPWMRACLCALDEGASARDRVKAPWIILAHEPPSGLPISEGDGGVPCGSDFIRSWIERFSPDILLSGHHHAAPLRHGVSSRLNSTLCINPGCDFGSAAPRHVVVDVEAGTAIVGGAV